MIVRFLILVSFFVLVRQIPIRWVRNSPTSGSYAVISGGTGGTGRRLIKLLKTRNITPIVLHRRSSFVSDDMLHM